MAKYAHVLIIAGPTSAGKTTLIKWLQTHREAPILRRLGVSDITTYGVVSESAIEDLPATPNLILHYDTLMAEYGGMTFKNDPALRLAQQAERLTVATLITPSARLRKQFLEGEFAGKPPTGINLYNIWQILPSALQRVTLRWIKRGAEYPARMRQYASLPMHREVYGRYQSDRNVQKIYNDWLAHAATMRKATGLKLAFEKKPVMLATV